MTDLAQLRTEIGSAFRLFTGTYALSYWPLPDGEALGMAEGEVFPAGSNIKIAILIELLCQAEEGGVRLDEQLTVEPPAVVEGSGLLRYFDLPLSLSVRDLATLMITVSDNVATNLLIDRVGLPSVNRRLAAFGFPNLRLNRKMLDWQAQREGRDNTCTAAELSGLLAALWSGRLLSPDATAVALDLLKKTQDRSRLRYLLPRSVEVAHKSGTGSGFENDAGIVFPTAANPYVLVVLNRDVLHATEGSQAVALASGLVFRHHTGTALPLLDLFDAAGRERLSRV